MKTNTEINAWEIQDNEQRAPGTTDADSKVWKVIDHVVSVSNVSVTYDEWNKLTNPCVTYDLVTLRIGDQEVIVNGTDLRIAIDNALHIGEEASTDVWEPYRRILSN